MKKPLAYRMRPKYLNDVIGQLDLVGPTGFLTNCYLKIHSSLSFFLDLLAQERQQ